MKNRLIDNLLEMDISMPLDSSVVAKRNIIVSP